MTLMLLCFSLLVVWGERAAAAGGGRRVAAQRERGCYVKPREDLAGGVGRRLELAHGGSVFRGRECSCPP